MQVSEFRSKKQLFSPSLCLQGIWMANADIKYQRSIDIKNQDKTITKEKNLIVCLRTISGIGKLNLKNVTYTLEKDSIIFFYLNQTRFYRTLTAPWQFIWIEFLIDYPLFEFEKLYNVANNEKETTTFQNIVLNFDNIELDDTDLFQSTLFSLQLVRWNNFIKRQNNDNYSHHARAELSLSFISKNYQNPSLSCKDIADFLNLSERRFRDIFKETVKTQPNHYINQYRINIARNLLRNTNDPITKIAFETGFTTQSYFCSMFKKHMNISPTDYRNNTSIDSKNIV